MPRYTHSVKFGNSISPLRAARKHPDFYWNIIRLASNTEVPPDDVEFGYTYDVAFNYPDVKSAQLKNICIEARYKPSNIYKAVPIDFVPFQAQEQLDYFRRMKPEELDLLRHE